MRRALGWVVFAALWPVVWVVGVFDDLAMMLDDDPWAVDDE